MPRLPAHFNPNHRIIPEDSPLYDNPNDLKFQGPELSWFWVAAGIIAGAAGQARKNAAKREAQRAAAEARAEAQRATGEYNRVATEINKEMAEREAIDKKVTAEQESSLALATGKREAAQENLETTRRTTAAEVQFAADQTQLTIDNIQKNTQIQQAAAERQAAYEAAKVRSPKLRGLATIAVAGPKVSGTGAPGSETKSSKKKVPIALNI